MPSPSIPPDQQAIFALGEFAGLSSKLPSDDLTQDTDSATFKAISSALKNAAPTIGTWNIVWGPAVAQITGSTPAINTMYVAQSAATPSQYVIAIAGTNFGSVIDWLVEDLFVEWQVPWVYAPIESPDSKISLGTAVGFGILQNMRPSSQVPGAGASLVEFLSTITGSPVQITTVGHSLGGALAPTVALWLADTQGWFSPWDSNNHATVSTLATAGPTAGDANFAIYSGLKLGDRLHAYYNTLDVVPHAWQSSMFAKIPSLYEPYISAKDLSMLPLDGLVIVLGLLTASGNYMALPGLTALPGEFKTVDGTDAFNQFITELGYQHIAAYYGPFHFNPNWLPVPATTPVPPSPDLVKALSSKSPTPGDVAAALSARGTRKLLIGGNLVDAPISASDPRGSEVVAQITAELKKHGRTNAGG